MVKFLIGLLIFSSFSSFSFCYDKRVTASLLAKLEWQTEDYPPYNYLNSKNELVGVFPEVLTLIYHKLDINSSFGIQNK